MTGIRPQYLLPRGVASPDAPVTSRDDLVAFLAAGAKPHGPQLVGVELERVPLLADATAAPYSGGDGRTVEALLQHLARERGWEPTVQEGRLLGLQRAGAQVHLEPGGQVEIALPPHRTARAIASDLAAWQEDLASGSRATGVSAIALGFQPVTPVARIGWVPKARYALMSEHLGARGARGHAMMKATAGVQFTVDFAGEDDADAIVRAVLAVAPAFDAMAANSPLEEGRPNGALTIRPSVWADTDPARTGLLPWTLEGGYAHARYVEWALDVPVIFVVREDRWIGVGDRTFRNLLDREDPRVGPPRMADWALHLTTLFPEVRVKQQIEIRGADSCSIDMNVALAAAWRGLLYDPASRADATALADGWDARDRQRLHLEAAREGLAASVRGTRLREVAEEVVRLADAGLSRLADGEADRALLEPLRAVATSGEPPARSVLAAWDAGGPAALLRLP